LTTIEEMAAHYLNEIRRVQPNGPYHFLGYSFGGIVVLEMAHQLHAAGEKVGMLGMLDTRARDYMRMKSAQVSTSASVEQRGLTGYVHRSMRHGSSKKWLQFFVTDLKERRIRYVTKLAAKVFPKIPAVLKNTHEINSYAARNYRVRPIADKLTLFRAAEQADPSIASDNGWSSIFTKGIEIHEVPGDHWHVLYEPGIDVLAKSIHDCLIALR
jgi:thioesterase domain-containing protein